MKASAGIAAADPEVRGSPKINRRAAGGEKAHNRDSHLSEGGKIT